MRLREFCLVIAERENAYADARQLILFPSLSFSRCSCTLRPSLLMLPSLSKRLVGCTACCARAARIVRNWSRWFDSKMRIWEALTLLAIKLAHDSAIRLASDTAVLHLRRWTTPLTGGSAVAYSAWSCLGIRLEHERLDSKSRYSKKPCVHTELLRGDTSPRKCSQVTSYQAQAGQRGSARGPAARSIRPRVCLTTHS